MAYNWGRARSPITDDRPMVGRGRVVGRQRRRRRLERPRRLRRAGRLAPQDRRSPRTAGAATSTGGRSPSAAAAGRPASSTSTTARSERPSGPEITGTPAVGDALTARPRPLEARRDVRRAVVRRRRPGRRRHGQVLHADRGPAPQAAPGPGHGHRPRLRARHGEAPPRARVAPRHDETDVAPTITGTPRVDEVLVLQRRRRLADAPTAAPCRWYADGERITGADRPRLTLTQEHIRTPDHRRRRAPPRGLPRARGDDRPHAGGRGRPVRGPEPFDPHRHPAARRTARPSSPGTYSPPDAAVDYTWLRDGEPIARRHRARRTTPTVDDVGHQLSVRVDLRRAGYRDHVGTCGPPAGSPRAHAAGSRPRARPAPRGRAGSGSPPRAWTSPGGRATVRVGGREVTGGWSTAGCGWSWAAWRPAGTRPGRLRRHRRSCCGQRDRPGAGPRR